MTNKRNTLKINIWGAPNQFTPEHGAGGYYKYHDDPAVKSKGKTRRQRQIDRKRPLPGGKINRKTVA